MTRRTRESPPRIRETGLPTKISVHMLSFGNEAETDQHERDAVSDLPERDRLQCVAPRERSA